MQPATTIYTIQLAIAIPQPQYSLTHLLYVPLSVPFSQISATWTLYQGISRTCPLIPPHTHYCTNLESIQTGKVFSSSNFPYGKIESGAFIKMGDLIPTHLGLDDTVCSKLRCSITTIIDSLLYLCNCQDTTSSHFRPHGIPDSDSVSQQRIPQ